MRTKPRNSALVRTVVAYMPADPRIPTSAETMGTNDTVKQKNAILSTKITETAGVKTCPN